MKQLGFRIVGILLCASALTGCSGSSTAQAKNDSLATESSTPAAMASAQAPLLAVNAAVPLFQAQALNGANISIGGNSDSLTLLNVWATWCTSCREEMADLESLHNTYRTRGVRVVAVSLDAGRTEMVQRFVQHEKLTFAVVHDRAARLQKLYHVSGVPSSYLVGTDGRLIWQQAGGLHGASERVRAVIDSVVGETR